MVSVRRELQRQELRIHLEPDITIRRRVQKVLEINVLRILFFYRPSIQQKSKSTTTTTTTVNCTKLGVLQRLHRTESSDTGSSYSHTFFLPFLFYSKGRVHKKLTFYTTILTIYFINSILKVIYDNRERKFLIKILATTL